jgi:hypothetical protein
VVFFSPGLTMATPEQCSTVGDRHPKGRRFVHRLAFGVNRLAPAFWVLAPIRNEAPARWGPVTPRRFDGCAGLPAGPGLAQRSTGRIIASAGIAHIQAIHDGIPDRFTALGDSPARGRYVVCLRRSTILRTVLSGLRWKSLRREVNSRDCCCQEVSLRRPLAGSANMLWADFSHREGSPPSARRSRTAAQASASAASALHNRPLRGTRWRGPLRRRTGRRSVR